MSSVSEIRQRLIDSQLMKPSAVDGHVARWREATGASGDAPGQQLVDWLVQQQLLTEFQGDALRAGHTGPFMLGPYRVYERMAQGRLGNIYRAVHDELAQPVSLKVYPSTVKEDKEKMARMRRELRVSVELEHPNLVRTFQVGRVGDICYMAFEDLAGETLLARVEREGALPYGLACKLIREAALGLAHLHEKGLIHRDVNPGNMWITASGVLKLMEWAAVRDALGLVLIPPEEEPLTHPDMMIGVFDYMAPEQARNAHAADHRSDIYSLGCTLYHCLAGKRPFREKSPYKMVAQHASEMPPPLTDIAPQLPPQLCNTVNSMMAKSPDERFQNALDLAWALEPYVGAAELSAPEQAHVSPEYQQRLRALSEETIAPRSPELASFLAWLAAKNPLKI